MMCSFSWACSFAHQGGSSCGSQTTVVSCVRVTFRGDPTDGLWLSHTAYCRIMLCVEMGFTWSWRRSLDQVKNVSTQMEHLVVTNADYNWKKAWTMENVSCHCTCRKPAHSKSAVHSRWYLCARKPIIMSSAPSQRMDVSQHSASSEIVPKDLFKLNRKAPIVPHAYAYTFRTLYVLLFHTLVIFSSNK